MRTYSVCWWAALCISSHFEHGLAAGSQHRLGKSNARYDPFEFAEAFAAEPRKEKWWAPAQAALAKRVQSLPEQVDIIIYGDSITEYASGAHMGLSTPAAEETASVETAAFKAFKAEGLSPLLLGISGDQTPHLLWRLGNGEWPRRPPKIAVLFIGTNDLANAMKSSGPVSLAVGVARAYATIKHIVRFILEESGGSTHVVLQAPLPRGHTVKPRSYFALPGIYSEAVGQLALHLEAFSRHHSMVHYLDAGAPFVAERGDRLLEELLPDALHPNAAGEAAMDAIRAPFLKGLLLRM